MNAVQSLVFPALFLLLGSLPGSKAAATVQVDKEAYCQGEMINVNFDGVEGEGVWIGIFGTRDVNDISSLPDWSLGALKGWILTCGERSEQGCAVWPTQGQVHLETEVLVPDEYVVVVSGDRASLSAQAATNPFQVNDCSQPNSAPVDETTTAMPTRFPTAAPIAPAPITPPITPPITVPSNPPVTVPTLTPGGGVRVITDPNIAGAIANARGQIDALVRADDDLIGKFLRLVFHDCVGGCDGCVDMTNGSHAGLAKPIEALSPIVAQFANQGLTRTDIWMLSALVATEIALPDDMKDISFGLNFIGRKTCETFGDCGNDSQGQPTTCEEMRGPHVEMCHGGAGTATMHNFFETEFGFTPQQITAIMGAHSVGGMHRENSGNRGNWDLSKASLDAGYWIELIGNPPDYFIEEVDNSDLGKPNAKQWLGILNPNEVVVMLNTDMALVRNIPDIEQGIDCDFNGANACSHDTPFMPHVRTYLADTRQFLMDFRDVMSILIDHGHDKAGECPQGSICTFGFNEAAFVESSPQPVVPPTPAPAEPPSFTIPQSGEAIITVDKPCYTAGETIVTSYENIQGQGVWIGVFPAELVTDFTQLPPFESQELLAWSFLCGFNDIADCHTWTSLGGANLSTVKLTPGSYAAVISGPGGNTDGQAAVNFRFADSC